MLYPGPGYAWGSGAGGSSSLGSVLPWAGLGIAGLGIGYSLWPKEDPNRMIDKYWDIGRAPAGMAELFSSAQLDLARRKGVLSTASTRGIHRKMDLGMSRARGIVGTPARVAATRNMRQSGNKAYLGLERILENRRKKFTLQSVGQTFDYMSKLQYALGEYAQREKSRELSYAIERSKMDRASQQARKGAVLNLGTTAALAGVTLATGGAAAPYTLPMMVGSGLGAAQALGTKYQGGLDWQGAVRGHDWLGSRSTQAQDTVLPENSISPVQEFEDYLKAYNWK